MLKKKLNSQAQSISEYVILIGIVSAVLITMQVYMKRSIQAVVKVSADELGSQQDSARDIYGTNEDSSSQTFTNTTRRTRGLSGGGARVDFNTTSNTTSVTKATRETKAGSQEPLPEE